MSQETLLLRVDPEAVAALGFALQRTIDDLAARALVAERHGDDMQLGEDSANEYQADIGRLMVLLSQLDGFEVREPDPERDPLAWLGGLYAIRSGQPVPIGPLEPFERLLTVALNRSHAGHLSGVELAAALELASGVSRDVLLERARPPRRPDSSRTGTVVDQPAAAHSPS